MAEQKKWAIGYLVAFAIMIFLNYWSATNVGFVANNNQSIIQPAGFAFSIWGVIYVLLFIWIIKIFFSRTWEDSMAYRLKFWPIINFLLNGAWILVFTQQWLIASTIVIAALLYTLAEMYSTMTETGYHWFDRLPFSIYFAWVTVATIVNIFTVTVSNNVETILGLDELAWTVIILIVATLIGLAIAFFFKDWLYPLVIIWPYYGIYAESGSEYTSVSITLLIGSIALLLAAIVVGFKNLRS
ncbi:tryptophan-rich sensory protein [Salinicoccus cyprini]|uniref:Tryptophan-rich sensory protein n=1 Tax=Salinicoccus cyprini TaxID=2493691 RepID=A0A558AUZ8_9STAP|nr:tryptophan-rich sensory protein [Salinicoccus cyprini]TVT28079.1 tryptophan-rich sensory protein [Salinicoccus cyprini]